MEITKVEAPREFQGWFPFVENFKPIPNKFSSDPNEMLYETYGEEVEFVQNYDPKHVWTLVTGDMCDLIIAGYHYVNRLGYYITENPWDFDDDTVLLSVEEECDCYSEDDEVMASRNDEYGDPNCPKCEGYGLVTRYVD